MMDNLIKTALDLDAVMKEEKSEFDTALMERTIEKFNVGIPKVYNDFTTSLHFDTVDNDIVITIRGKK